MIELKLWYCLCLLFFGYSIITLIGEKYEVNYQLESKKETIQYSTCFRLTTIFKDKDIINLDELNYDLYYMVMSNKNKISIINAHIFESLLKEIKFKRYFIYRQHICINFDELDRWIGQIEHFINSTPKLFASNKEVCEFYRLKAYSLAISQLIVQDLEYPYSKCSKKADHFSCLNQCVKDSGQRLSKYYFKGNENSQIYLKYRMNKTTIDNEFRYVFSHLPTFILIFYTFFFRCVKKCKSQIPCKLVNFIARYYVATEDKKTRVFKSYPSIKELDYWFQFVSLICLILNISLYQLMFKLFIILALKFKSLYAYLQLSKKLILLPNLFLSFFLLTSIVKNFLDKRDNPIRREITTSIVQPGTLILAICIDIFDILDDNDDYVNETYFGIERLLEARFDPNAIELYLEFFNERIEIDWSFLKSKTIYLGLFKCYIIEMKSIKSANDYLFPLTKLKIQSEYENFLIYILPENLEFTSKTFQLDPRYSFLKRIIKRSKSNKKLECLDYKEMKENCSTR